VTVIDDSYNSNPKALIEAVRAMTEAKGFQRRIVVAGEMLELGEQGAELHRQCGQEIAALGVDMLIGVRGLAKEMVAAAKDIATFCESPEEAADTLIAKTHPRRSGVGQRFARSSNGKSDRTITQRVRVCDDKLKECR
jgi:UDP-N-acetylmuramoyl-tripeptide--D-alanyl-D-alanine ligase